MPWLLASEIGLSDGRGFGGAETKSTEQSSSAQLLHLQSRHQNLCPAGTPGSPCASDELGNLTILRPNGAAHVARSLLQMVMCGLGTQL